ncbi:MAG: hypothetical protein ACXIUM_07505 [Wenzhouxiangella sp.]
MSELALPVGWYPMDRSICVPKRINRRGLHVSLQTVAFLLLVVGFITGCASNIPFDYGAVIHAREAPATAMNCLEVDWQRVEQVPPDVSEDLVLQRLEGHDARASNSLWFTYDVDETGAPVNILFVRPESYTRHATMRELIRHAAEALEQWRFHANGSLAFVTACETKFEFHYSIEHLP